MTAELQEIQTAVDEAAAQKVSLSQAFRTRAAKKGLAIAFGLMIFQQLSGVNAVIFYTSNIFEVSCLPQYGLLSSHDKRYQVGQNVKKILPQNN